MTCAHDTGFLLSGGVLKGKNPEAVDEVRLRRYKSVLRSGLTAPWPLFDGGQKVQLKHGPREGWKAS